MIKILLVGLVLVFVLNGCGAGATPRLGTSSNFDDETLSHNKVNWSLVGFNIHTGNYTEVVK